MSRLNKCRATATKRIQYFSAGLYTINIEQRPYNLGIEFTLVFMQPVDRVAGVLPLLSVIYIIPVFKSELSGWYNILFNLRMRKIDQLIDIFTICWSRNCQPGF